jgi:hypothetical protein
MISTRRTTNYLRKGSKEDYRRWKDLPYSWIGRIKKAKMAILK